MSYSQSAAHEVHKVRVLNLKNGDWDRGFVPLGFRNLWSLLGDNGWGVESLEEEVPSGKKHVEREGEGD